jgi:hypothetical protein
MRRKQRRLTISKLHNEKSCTNKVLLRIADGPSGVSILTPLVLFMVSLYTFRHIMSDMNGLIAAACAHTRCLHALYPSDSLHWLPRLSFLRAGVADGTPLMVEE